MICDPPILHRQLSALTTSLDLPTILASPMYTHYFEHCSLGLDKIVIRDSFKHQADVKIISLEVSWTNRIEVWQKPKPSLPGGNLKVWGLLWRLSLLNRYCSFGLFSKAAADTAFFNGHLVQSLLFWWEAWRRFHHRRWPWAKSGSEGLFKVSDWPFLERQQHCHAMLFCNLITQNM